MRAFITLFAVLVGVGGLLFFAARSSDDVGGNEKPKFSEAEYTRHYEAEEKALSRILGPMNALVGHAGIPFQVGGMVDMYYFPNAIPGTGLATMKLIEPDGSGPMPNCIGTYELVAFTKLKMPAPEAKRDSHGPFRVMERSMCGILTRVGRYSYHAALSPGETCEMPGWKGEPAKCLILDEFRKEGAPFEVNGKKYCLLLCIEVFRSEMEYAIKNGTASVLDRLKEKGYYPYSDLDREPVF